MKKIFIMLAIATLSTTTTMAQSAKELAQQQKELNDIHLKMLKAKPTKEAKRLAKELKKDGWTVPAGERSIEQQIMQSMSMMEERTVDENGNTIKRFIAQTGQQTAGTYNAAYAAARSNAQVELATVLKTQVTAAMKSKLDNSQSSSISAVTVDKFNQRAMAIVDETLTNSIPLLTIYRRLSNNSFEVQVQMAYDKKELAARLKRNMQRELEAEGDELNKIVEKVISDNF